MAIPLAILGWVLLPQIVNIAALRQHPEEPLVKGAILLRRLPQVKLSSCGRGG